MKKKNIFKNVLIYGAIILMSFSMFAALIVAVI